MPNVLGLQIDPANGINDIMIPNFIYKNIVTIVLNLLYAATASRYTHVYLTAAAEPPALPLPQLPNSDLGQYIHLYFQLKTVRALMLFYK